MSGLLACGLGAILVVTAVILWVVIGRPAAAEAEISADDDVVDVEREP